MRLPTLFSGALVLLVLDGCTTGVAEQNAAVPCEKAAQEILHALHQSDSLLAVGDSVGAWWEKAYTVEILASGESQVVPFTRACHRFPVPRPALDPHLAFLANHGYLYRADSTSLFARNPSGRPPRWIHNGRPLDAHFAWMHQQFRITWGTDPDSHAVQWVQTLYP